MKTWLKLTLAIGVGAALWGGLFLDQHLAEKEEISKKQEVKVLDFETRDVLKLVVQNKSGKYVFQRDAAASNWKMLEPVGPRPDQDTVNNLLAALQSTTYEQQVEDTQKIADAVIKGDASGAKDFGFDAPRAQLELELAANKETGSKARTLKLWLGGDVNIGGGAGAAFNAMSVYVVSTDRTGLLVVGSALQTSLSKELKDFRSKLVGDFLVSDVSEFELLKNDGSLITLTKTQENGQSKWTIKTPKSVRADNNQVGLYLDTWNRLRAESVTEPASLDIQGRAALGLEKPNATLTVKGEGGKVLQTINIGLTTGSLYATMPDGAVGRFELTKFAELAPELKYFRDRRVFSGISFNDVSVLKTISGKMYQKEDRNWYLQGATPAADTKKPEKVASEDARKFVEDWEFSTAEDILDADQTANLASFGLDKPITRFSLSASDEKKLQVEILVGNRVPNNEKAVYVKRADAPEVYVLETKWLDVLTRLDQGGQSPQAKK